MHVDEQIIQNVVELFQLSPTITENVFDSQVYPLSSSELPAVMVDTDDEEIEELDMGEDPTLQRQFRFVIVIKVSQTAEYRAAVNAIRVRVENLLAVNRTLGGACNSLIPRGCTWELDDGEEPIASATLQYEASVVTSMSEPETSI